MFTVEGPKTITVITSASILEESRDLAWAERSVRFNPNYKWILGKYVEADAANSNRQYWSLDELKKNHQKLHSAPLNLLHKPNRIVGTYVDTELMFPTDAADGDSVANPFVEALAAFWSYYFPEELKEIESAHADGDLYFSMECKAETITEMWDDGSEGETFEYKGPSHESYSDAINSGECARRFNDTNFLGGALIVPPVSPGWKNASIKEISKALNVDWDAAKLDLEGGKDLSPAAWKAVMDMILDLAVR